MKAHSSNTIDVADRRFGVPLLPSLWMRGNHRLRASHAAEIYLLDRKRMERSLGQLASDLRSRYVQEPVLPADTELLQR